jgi:hypothetical protein
MSPKALPKQEHDGVPRTICQSATPPTAVKNDNAANLTYCRASPLKSQPPKNNSTAIRAICHSREPKTPCSPKGSTNMS